MTAAGVRWYQRRWVRWIVSLGLVCLLLASLRPESGAWLESASSVRWWPLALALLVRLIAVGTNAWHASLVLQSAGCNLPVPAVWRAHMFGEMLSRFVPGNLGTLAYVAKLSDRASEAVVAQLVDRVLFLLVMLATAAVALGVAQYPAPAALAGSAFLGSGLLAYQAHRGALRWLPPSRAHSMVVQKVLSQGRYWWCRYLLAAVLSLAFMTINFSLLVLACGGRSQISESLAAVCLVSIGAALPVTINGIGVREWVFLALMADNLPGKAAVITLSALTYLTGFASALVGVATWAVTRPRRAIVDA